LKWVRNIEIWNKLVRKKEDYQDYQDYQDEEDQDEEVQEDEGLRKP